MKKQHSITEDLSAAIRRVTREWKRAKRRANKEDRVSPHELGRLSHRNVVSIREAAFEAMEEAYNKTSSNGKFYAQARQIYYQARPKILEKTGRNQLDSRYFTQTLLKDYIEETGVQWRVIWDDRGHFTEPHTGISFGVGGKDVHHYLSQRRNTLEQVSEGNSYILKKLLQTAGPNFRYKSILFIEKEGFNEILDEAKIAETFDLAIVSTKGIPVKAACDLFAALSDTVTIYVVHDFDLAGFKILKTLREGTRLSRGVEVVDLGLRLEDVKGLPTEPVKERGKNIARYLLKCGATIAEIRFLLRPADRNGIGQRVELNAMTTEQFVTWLKRKLKEHGVKKVIPNQEVLKKTYVRAVRAQEISRRIEEMENELESRKIKPPTKLLDTVVRELRKYPTRSWDEEIWDLAEKQNG